jgi:hypothetical protein
MAYNERLHVGSALMWRSNAFLTAANLAATAADWAEIHCHHPVQVRRISFGITTAVTAGTTAPQVTVYRRPTAGSNSGQVLLGTLIIPNGTAAGSIVYKELESVRVKAGEGLAFRVNVQAVDGGTAAGLGFAGALVEMDPEYPGNQSLMIASA